MGIATRVTYDNSVDAAYVSLVGIADGEVERTIEAETGINLDFDDKGRLLGIEILNASQRMRPEALANAEDVTPDEITGVTGRLITFAGRRAG